MQLAGSDMIRGSSEGGVKVARTALRCFSLVSSEEEGRGGSLVVAQRESALNLSKSSVRFFKRGPIIDAFRTRAGSDH